MPAAALQPTRCLCGRRLFADKAALSSRAVCTMAGGGRSAKGGWGWWSCILASIQSHACCKTLWPDFIIKQRGNRGGQFGDEYSYFFSFIIHYVSHQENKRFPPETLTELTESRSQLCQQCAKSRLLGFFC